jgi:hypothetical protein
MTKRVVSIVFAGAIIFCSSLAYSGVEPSPFKEFKNRLQQVIYQLNHVVDSRRDIPFEMQDKAREISNRLQSAYDKISRYGHISMIAARSVFVMDLISTRLNPETEAPSLEVLGRMFSILDRLSLVALNPQPEPPAHKLKGIGIMERITAKLFNPQPEPPGRERMAIGIELLDRISAVAFNPQPEPPAHTAQVLSILDRLASVAFNPQPEPPGNDPLREMFVIIDLMSKISAQSAR